MGEIDVFASKVTQNIEKVIVGKSSAIEMIMVALLCEGHILIEDMPGSGKTMLARSIAISLGLNCKRIQCTPDLMPNDVTGVSIFNQKTGEFEFRPGPVFVNILLADEINRATPRTQSALLEAMQEQQVTVDGISRQLPRPFLVLATQNPIEYEGTFPLPEAQLDRFLMRISLGYPDTKDERQILINLQREHPISKLTKVVDGTDLLPLQKLVWDIHVDETIQAYIVAISNSTRNHPDLLLGISPRGSLALFRTAQAYAAIQKRDYVLPDDIKFLAPYTLAHRLVVRPEAELHGRNANSILQEVLDNTPLHLGKLSD